MNSPDNGVIPLHFDVPEHHIPLEQFIDSARSAQDIIDNFNSEFFDKKLKYELLVITPQTGGLIELLQVVVPVAAPFWAFLGTDIGKAYIKGLTDHEPAFWAEKLGKKTRELTDIDKQKVCACLLALMTIGFLKKDTIDLENTGFSQEGFRTAYLARNRVYEGCINNPRVQALGFDTSHDFPIKRDDFQGFIVELPSLKGEPPELEASPRWKVDTVDLIVHSPNWKRDSNRKWQGSSTEKKDIPFIIEDENFWHHVTIKDINPNINDNMRVQWAYPENIVKLTNVRVLRVVSYNGTHISDPLTESELLSALAVPDITIEEKVQLELFTYKQESTQ